MGLFNRETGKMLFTLVEDAVIDGRAYRAGEKVNMAVTPADTANQTREIDTYLGGYKPYEFCIDLASKIVPVDTEKGVRRDFSLENAFEVVDTFVGRSGAINEIDHASYKTPYATEEHALATFIPWSAQNDAVGLYNVRVASATMIYNKLALAHEVRGWNMFCNAANWGVNNKTQLSSGTQWDIGASSDPLKNLHDRIDASAQPVSDIFMNTNVAYAMLSHTKVQAWMRAQLGDSAPRPEVATGANAQQKVVTFQLPGFPPITVCPAKRKSVSTGYLEHVLGNHVVLVASPAGVPRDGSEMATSYCFRTRGPNGTGITTNEYTPQGRGLNGGIMFEVGYGETTFICSNIAGGFIQDVIAGS